MFKIQELVNLINSGLNGVDTNYSFNVYAEVGEEKNDGSINGVLRTVGNDTTKIKGDSETRYTFVVEMPIISPRTNSNFLEIQQIVEQFVNTYNGSSQSFSSGKGVLHVNMGVPKQFNVAVNLGDNVPLAFTIEMLYTESNITNADKHWFLGDYDALTDKWNYYEIPFKRENVLVNKDGIVRKINNKNYTEAFLTGQTKYYKFLFPYQDTTLGNLIQKDLLNGNFDKEYKLKYYDGKNFTAESPFETRVSIYNNGDTGTEEINVSMFNLTFADVDNGSYDWTYQLALIDSKFDNQTEDTRWFNSQAEQQAYYEEKVLSGCAFVTIKAPNLNSLDITSQVYPNTQGYNVFDLTNKNYAIIKATKPVGQITQTRYFYYWVTNAQIGANGQVMFDLQLDTVQTYLFDEDLVIGDCLIERSCLNRFVDNGDGTVSFDGGVDSKLFAREKIQNVPKRLTKRTKLGSCHTGNETFDDWINSKVLGWIYIFLNPSAAVPLDIYANQTADDTTLVNNATKKYEGLNILAKTGYATISQPLPCIIFPVMKGGATIPTLKVKDDYNRTINIALGNYYNPITQELSIMEDGVNALLNKIGTSNVYATKFSTLCPFEKMTNDYYTVSTNTLTLNYISTLTSIIVNDHVNIGYTFNDPLNNMQVYKGHDIANCVFFYKFVQYANYDLGNYNINKTLTFNKNAIIGANKSTQFNPKLLSQDYFELQVCDETENGFAYDVQKLNKNQIKIGLTETLTPDNTKKYIRITDNNGVYVSDTKENLLGFVNNNDQTIVLASDQYANMLAQNKNYFTQNALNRDISGVKTLTGIGQSIAQGAIIGAMTGNPIAALTGAAIGGIGSAIGGMINYVQNDINRDLTIDNLKNAPASIQQALGNCYFGAQYTEPGTYVEEYDILPAEKNVINDYMVQYGFTTNQIGQVMDYLNGNPTNGRVLFNYIQAVVNSISGIPMSNTARQNLRDRFAKGIRFWNDDNVDYTKENFERWIGIDLTLLRTTWLINNSPNVNTDMFVNEFTIISNNKTFNTIKIEDGKLYYGDTLVYNGSSWINDAYKKIYFYEIGLGYATLRNWIKANATLIKV